MSDTRPTISLRFTEDQKKEIEAMCETAGIPPATLAKKCLLSALDYFQKHGDVPMPPAIVRQSQAAVIDELEAMNRIHNGQSTSDERPGKKAS